MATRKRTPAPTAADLATAAHTLELVIASDEVVRLWFSNARMTAKGKDALAIAMGQLRDVLARPEPRP